MLICIYYIIKGIMWSLKKTKGSTPKTKQAIFNFLIVSGKFFKLAFINIHSDIRLLCGVDSALGATAGYLLGNALYGGLIGVMFGLINYYVISIKVLKLQPQKESQ